MTIAERARGSSPACFSRLKVSRQEMPVSTRTRVRVVATRAQFPRLPLASTETVTPMPVSIPSYIVEAIVTIRLAATFGMQLRAGFHFRPQLGNQPTPDRPTVCAGCCAYESEE